MAKTVKTRLLFISDTHSGFSNVDNPSSPHYGKESFAFRPPFPEADVLIHTGDLTMLGRPKEYRLALEMLAAMPARLKLVIAGNHDLSLHRDFYVNQRHQNVPELHQAKHLDYDGYDARNADIAEAIWTGEEALKAGVTYLTEGVHHFNLDNGAELKVYASPWQPEFCDWAFNYPLHEDRWNPPQLVNTATGTRGNSATPAPPVRDPHPIPEDTRIDIVMTHGPAWTHRDKCSSSYLAGCPHLLVALDRVRPLIHCCGHIHEAWGGERIQWRSLGSPAPSLAAWKALAQTGIGPLGEKTEVLGSHRLGQTPKSAEVVERRAAYVDLSSTGPQPLRVGDETVVVNSSIMDLRYQARGAPWLVDVDLPLADAT